MDKLPDEIQVPNGILKGIYFDILTEADAEIMSVKVISASNEVTDPMLGLPNPSSQCLTCGAKNSRYCEGHLGLIKFPYTILHPYFMPEVAQILNRICPGCRSIKKWKKNESTSSDKQTVCKYCDGSLKDQYPPLKFKVSSKDVFAKTAIIAEMKVPKNMISGRAPAKDYWEFVPKDPQQEGSSESSNKRVLTHAQVYQLLKDLDPSFIKEFVPRKNSIFLQCFPLTPNCHRVTEFGQHISFDQRTKSYQNLINCKGSANVLSDRANDSLKLSKVRSEKVSTNRYAFTAESPPKMTGLKYIKDLLLAKMCNNVIRMVCVGDPFIGLDEIGVPRDIADQMLVSENLNELNWEEMHACCALRNLVKGQIFVRREGKPIRLKFWDKLRIGDAIDRPLRDGDIVLINRPPSIHPHSLLALSVKILPTNSVLSINPLICSPLRGDFDGDSLHVYIPQSVDTRVELHELVSMKNQLVDKQSGQNLLSLSHDSLTAAHLLVEDGVLIDKFQMQQLQMYCPHQFEMPAVIKAQSARASSSFLWTGKQLFGGLLPRDFNYSSWRVNIKNGELLDSTGGSSWLRDGDENIFQSLIKNCPREEVLKFLDAAQEVLLEWLSMRGFSVSLSDLYLSLDSDTRKNLTDDVLCGLLEAERVSHDELLMVDSYELLFDENVSHDSLKYKSFGEDLMCYKQQKSAALSRASISAFKQVFLDIQSLIYNYSSMDNSFMTMLKAGSKGNVQKFVQHSMCLAQQHSMVPLGFHFPRQLSCSGWNDHKIAELNGPPDSMPCVQKFIPCAVIKNSFLTGLNPLEMFVHSVVTRDSSFGGHADISGTLNRKLMFFMRDLYAGYDGTVRNLYGNQLVQFKYDIEDTSLASNSCGRSLVDNVVGGEPVGALAACAITEAAYGALDQPISVLESSPLLNLKKVLDCGIKRAYGDKTASLFLSKKLNRRTYGMEYGALEVKNHLEKIMFQDIVTVVKILRRPPTRRPSTSLSPETYSYSSPWVCHFHISKEAVTKKQLTIQSIINMLNMKSNSIRTKKSKISLPRLRVMRNCGECSDNDGKKEHDEKICIAVQLAENIQNTSAEIDILRDMVIPFLLGTVIKGSTYVKKVDILWKDGKNISKSRTGSSGELYLRVFMSEKCDRRKFWNLLMDDCIQIMNLIDWEHSHPDDINDLTSALGIDAAWRHFVTNLKNTLSDTGKNVLPEHLVLTASSLSATGEFLSLTFKGLADQRKQTSVSSPFMQACLAKPADCFVKAAKSGATDSLQGTIDALSWGKVPSLGTGAKFDILYSGKGHEIEESTDIYSLLASNDSKLERKVGETVSEMRNHSYDKTPGRRLFTNKDFDAKGSEEFKSMLQKSDLKRRIPRLPRELGHILRKYDIDNPLGEDDLLTALMALYFHPRRREKIGCGAQEIKVAYHSKHGESRCFQVVRTDGTVEDFSYHKCVENAMDLIGMKKPKTNQSKLINGKLGKHMWGEANGKNEKGESEIISENVEEQGFSLENSKAGLVESVEVIN